MPRYFFLAVSIVLSVLAACSDGTTEPPPTDERGTRLRPSGSWTIIDWEYEQVAWTADGSEIIHLGPTGQLEAVNAATGAARPLVASETFMTLRTSAGGTWLFATASAGSGADWSARLFRVDPVTGSSQEIVPRTLPGFGISPDGRWVLYEARGAPDVHLLDVLTGESRVVCVAGCGIPVSVSPGGESGATSMNGALRRIDLSDGTSSVLWQPADDRGQFPQAMRWVDDSRVEVLFREDSSLRVFDSGAGTERTVRALGGGIWPIFLAGWSGDGRWAALWGTENASGNRRLFVLDLASGAVAESGSARFPELATRPVFSPDARRIAFVSEKHLYVRTVR